MHNHNNDNKNDGHSGMMWMMIPCVILLGILFLGGGRLSSSGYLWPILIGVFILGHVWMMLRGHGGHGKHHDTSTSDDPSQKQLDTKSEHGEHNHS